MFSVGRKLQGKVLPWTLCTLIVLFQTMQFVASRTVLNELIPGEDPACPRIGEYGCLCAKNVNCNQTKFLECIDGRCACEFSLHRTFDESLGKCVSLVGSYCGNGWAPQCIRDSECEGGRCRCRDGYSNTLSNKCSISFGEECGPRQCNSDKGLACKEGRCQCLDSAYVYSVIHGTCINPEAVVRDFFQQLTQRVIQGIFNFKVRKAMRALTLPFRVVRRLALGPLGK